MTRLQDLYTTFGQSPWLDNLKRSYVTGGRLAELIGQGVRGLTSNPTIMAKAIEGGDEYDEQFSESMAAHNDVLNAYWDLVVQDVTDALELFRPLYDESEGSDGFVSIEVAPNLARETASTIEAARNLHERIDRPNLLVKIPASEQGVRAVRAMIAEGRSINVTLIFSLERYESVMEAYLGGLEDLVAKGGDPSKVASVASFFVSRVDTETDRRLEAVVADDPGSPRAERARSLRGRTAVAQARTAYEHFERRFAGPRWEALAARGARVQRPLWASTSTKNPAYSDLAYVDTLIGPSTVNTMPEETLARFLDHGKPARTVDADVESAHRVLSDLGSLGISMSDVAETLEDEGVTAFEKSFDEVIERLSEKASRLGMRADGADA